MTGDFESQGFCVIPGFFNLKRLEQLEHQITCIFMMQADKISDYHGVRARYLEDEQVDPAAAMRHLCAVMETADKEALYQAQKMLPRSQGVRGFFSPDLLAQCAVLLGVHPQDLLLDGPALFVNQPTVNRLLYRWHSEANYYGKRRRFLNLWFPIFGDRTAENGAMSLRPGSHKRVWDASLMVEYSGWDKAAEGKRSQFIQMEIPENFLTEYPRFECETKRGDLVIFDRNLVHTSNPNVSNEIAFSIVARVWTPIDDLTLSGDMEATPYGGNLGRAGLVVRP